MTLGEHITIYAGVIAVMLTLLRVISGITGSQTIRKAILLSATISTFALTGAGIMVIALEVSSISAYFQAHRQLSNNLSNTWFSIWFVFIAYNFGFGVILRLYIRSLRFKDWGTLHNLRAIPPFTWIRSAFRSRKRDKKTYETSKVVSSDKENLRKILIEHLGVQAASRRTLLLSGCDPWILREKLMDLLVNLIRETDEEINYVCCIVSPANIWTLLEEKFDSQTLDLCKKRLVFVDAYTETFGFGDDILSERIREMTVDKGIEIVSCNSAAGVHSGTARAFKILKKNAKQEKRERRPCTIIYDTLSVLSITETETEVAEFIIHLSAAELTYDMLTVFIEADIENRSSESLSAMRASCGTPITLNG